MYKEAFSCERIKDKDIIKYKEFLLDCPDCGQKTAHEVMAGAILNYENGDGVNSIQITDIHQIIKCNGCYFIRYRKIYYDPNYSYPDEPDISIYPAKRKTLNKDIPDFLERIYEETNSALANELPILVTIGLRSMIEAICKDIIKKLGSNEQGKLMEADLYNKIISLKDKHIFNNDFKEIIDFIRKKGNDATHETKALELNRLENAMQIIENFIRHHYISPKLASYGSLTTDSEMK